MIRVVVTGGGGQLAECLNSVAAEFPEINLVFFSYENLDITKRKNISAVFDSEAPFDFCINCAAYTAVDQAENDEEAAHLVNTIAPALLAKECKDRGITLIHISTDFVFSGTKNNPYREDDEANSISVYGKTKFQGEQAVLRELEQSFIIRTSWLYSEFGNNFVKTMLRLANERSSLSVVNDQFGSPTYAIDLSRAILHIIGSQSQDFGIYHFSNRGELTWYDFAAQIFKLNDSNIDLKPISSHEYPTAAKRPTYSVLDTTKIEKTFGIEIKDWQESLKTMLTRKDGF